MLNKDVRSTIFRCTSVSKFAAGFGFNKNVNKMENNCPDLRTTCGESRIPAARTCWETGTSPEPWKTRGQGVTWGRSVCVCVCVHANENKGFLSTGWRSLHIPFSETVQWGDSSRCKSETNRKCGKITTETVRKREKHHKRKSSVAISLHSRN